MQSIKRWLTVIAVFIFTTHAHAAPYTPDSSEKIVHVFTSSENMNKIKHLRKLLQANPDNYSVLDEVVSLYLSIGREKSNPVYFGYAEAILKPYLKNQKNPENIMLHWADILQHRHDFDQALQVLNELANKRGHYSKIYLLRAIIHISRGSYDLALSNCKSLISRASHLLTISCVAYVKSLTGELHESFNLLENSLAQSRHADTDEQGWALALLGDMAMRLGEHQVAERYYQRGIQLNNKDYYMLANYADLLLKHQQYERVINLLDDYKYVGSLFLRLTLASIKIDKLTGKKYIQDIDTTYRLNELLGEKSHLRDQARFYFKVKNNSKKALVLARKNWETQKEPADVKLLLDIALSENDTEIINEILAWHSSYSLEDIELENMLKEFL